MAPSLPLWAATSAATFLWRGALAQSPVKPPGNLTWAPSNAPSFHPTAHPGTETNVTTVAPTDFDASVVFDQPVSAWLVAVSVIACLMLAGVSFYILVYYQHEDDRNQAYFPKLVVMLTLSISEISVVLLALDVANRSGAVGCGQWNSICGGLSLDKAWQAMFGIAIVFCAGLIPFTIFFYESNEDGRSIKSRLCEALQYQGVAVGAAVLVLVLTWYNISSFQIPVASIGVVPTEAFEGCPGPLAEFSCMNVVYNQTIVLPGNVISWQLVSRDYVTPNNTIILATSNPQFTGDEVDNFLECPNTFWVFLGAEMSFVGWFLFCMFTGVGLITLPIDLVKKFVNRPKYIPKDVYLKLRDDIHRRVKELLATGLAMKKGRKDYESNYDKLGYRERWGKTGEQRNVFKEFKREVEIVEEDYEDIYQCHEAWKSYNPLIPYVKLVLGVLSGILSLCWFLHIFLFLIARYPWPDGPPVSYFLNRLVSWGLIDSGFALIGVFFVGLFGMYLLFANINGNFKIGLRFLILEIHPMKVGGTYMSSFLVNVLLLLLQMPALIQFLAIALSETVVLTDVDTIMNQSVRFTSFFKYFFVNNVFIFLLLAFSFLAGLMAYVFPSDRDSRTAKRLANKVDLLVREIDQAKLKASRAERVGLKEGESAFQKAKANQDRAGDDGADPEDGGDDDDKQGGLAAA